VVVSTLERVFEDARNAQLSAPALVVIGEIVRVREQLLALQGATAISRGVL
jgi:siroheme synthase